MYYYDDIIKYSEVDNNCQLPLYRLLELFQNCVNFQGRDIGKDFTDKDSTKEAWVLISWKIKLEKPVKLYDKVRVATWSYGSDKLYGYRNYAIFNENGERLACADTMWILIDLDSRMPQRVTESDLEGYAFGPAIEGIKASKRLRLSEDKEALPSAKVLKTYIDTNGHMNNTAYFRLAEEYLPEEFSYASVDAVYVKETTLGMTLLPYLHREPEGWGISFEGQDGTVYTKIKYTA